MQLPSTVKVEFQVALFLSSLGAAGALIAAVLCVILVIKKKYARQQSSSSHISQEETPIPLASIAMTPTNQTDYNSVSSSDINTTEVSGTYQLPLQPPIENPILEPSAPPPPWWWNP
ncbi:hypothetical protein ACJMK2_033377 [Sinanodonta woodiana]|uniref:Uncharacterized protein n=1 Tax=Sinanodonta woodiana TaxID=1069815 RepID=A0ABD3WN69_SINWO